MRKPRSVRNYAGRPARQTLKLITDKCAAYYKEGLTDFERRQLIQDIWRYANFAIIRMKRKQGRGRKAKKPDARLRKTPTDMTPRRETGFKCEAAVFNMGECKVQCDRCKS